jgi:hypothetical protein
MFRTNNFTNSRKLLKWKTSLVGSYLIPDTWVTSSNPGFPSYHAPITWVTTRATISHGFPMLFIAMCWMVTIRSNLETCLRIFVASVIQTLDLRILRWMLYQLSFAATSIRRPIQQSCIVYNWYSVTKLHNSCRLANFL